MNLHGLYMSFLTAKLKVTVDQKQQKTTMLLQNITGSLNIMGRN